jgi:hypothetical protein
VESSSYFCLGIRDIVRAGASHVIDDHFGLVLASQFESPRQGGHLRIILSRTQRVGRMFMTALACPEGPVLTGLALVQQGLGIEGTRTRLLFVPLVDVILLAKAEPTMGVLPVYRGRGTLSRFFFLIRYDRGGRRALGNVLVRGMARDSQKRSLL